MSSELSKDEQEQLDLIEKLQLEFMDKIGEYADSTIIISTKHFGMEGSVRVNQHHGNYYAVMHSVEEYLRDKYEKGKETVKRNMRSSQDESE